MPSGFTNTLGTSGLADPFNGGSDQLWQYQYDSTEFVEQGPMMINELYFRSPITGDDVGAFDFADVEVVLAEAATDLAATSATFAANIHRGVVVRAGPYQPSSDTSSAVGGGPAFIPLRLQKGFLYDPSLGRDLVVQIRVCGVNVPFGLFGGIDHVTTTVGRRSGNTTSCTAATTPQTNQKSP